MSLTALKRMVLVGFVAMGVAQCGDQDSLSKDVKLWVEPEVPIVINAPLTIRPGTDEEKTIDPPWFGWGYRVRNSSDSTLVLVTFTFDVETMQSGAVKKTSISLDPTEACPDDLEVDDGSKDNRAYMLQIPAGQSAINVTDYCDSTTITNSGSREIWYIYGLPETSTYTYFANVIGQGFFVDSQGTPIERLVLESSFSTQ